MRVAPPSRTCQTPSSTCTNCSNVPASNPRPTSTRRPPRSTTANALHVAATGPVARPDTSTASNVLLPAGACRSRRLRYRASVLNPTPRSRQNSLRFNPLDSNSATNCSTSCRLRRRRPSHTCCSFMPLLHHQIHRSNRWFPLTLTNKFTVYYPLLAGSQPPAAEDKVDINVLDRELRAASVPVINLTDPLRQAAAEALSRNELIYRSDDTHWNAAGVRVATEVILMAVNPRVRDGKPASPVG